MFKKLLFTAATAAAVSVPFAGAAWAAPDLSNNPPGHPESTAAGPGIPNEAAEFGNAVDQANPSLPKLNPGGGPLPPGQFYKDLAKMPGSTTAVTGDAVTSIYNNYQDIPDVTVTGTVTFDRIAPGMATKSFTPGCSSGQAVTHGNVNGGEPVCH